MEFFIKKNATLPLLKMQVVKDGRSDYNHFMDMIEVSSLFFSMTNIETGIPKILTKPAGFVEKILVNPDAGPEYYIYYQFTNLDTNMIGRYEGQFMLKNNDGVLILPIREKLFINISESFVADDLPYDSCYVIEFPCCVNPLPSPSVPAVSQTPTPTPTPTPTSTPILPPPSDDFYFIIIPNGGLEYLLIPNGDFNWEELGAFTISLYPIVYPGSINFKFILTCTYPISENIILNFTESFGLVTGGTIDITTSVTIPSGQISGETIVTLNNYNYTDLDLTYVISGATIQPSGATSYIQVSQTEFDFPVTPTPTTTPTLTPTPSPSYIPPIPFISIWRTTSSGETITLPYEEMGTYSGTIDWGDGNTTDNSYINRIHTYVTPGDYTISILGDCVGFRFNNGGNKTKIREITQWGNKFRLGNNNSYFYGCSNLVLTGVTDTLNLTGTDNLFLMFGQCSQITTVNRINEWNVSNIVNMSSMFYGSPFNQDISQWDVSNVTNMGFMFNFSQFNQDINSWNVSSVTSMGEMFSYSTFNQPIGNWNVSGVTIMNGMFLSSLFNQDISQWDVSNVTDMTFMFYGSSFNQNISSWDVSNVIYMNGMFNFSQFNQDISGWDVSSVIYMGGMFSNCTSFNQDLSSWCVPLIPSSPTNFDTGATSWVLPRPVWGTCPPFISIWRTTTPNESITLPYENTGTYDGIIDWGDGNTSVNSYSNITHTYVTPGDYTITISGDCVGFKFDIYSNNNEKIIEITQWGSKFRLGNNGGYFAGCSNLVLTGVTDVLNLQGTNNLYGIFDGCNQITTINRFNEWNVSNVTNMTYMFYNTLFNQNINGWDVSNVTNMTYMFYDSSFNQDITEWDVSNVTNMSFIFGLCLSFNQDISGWNVSGVTDMSGMFFNTQFNQDISGWNVSNATNMNSMFNRSQFNQDISGWNVSGVTSMGAMFLLTPFNQDISGWNTTNVTNMAGMFQKSQFNQNINNWDVSNVTNMGSMFSESSFNQPLDSWDVSSVNRMNGMFAIAPFNQPIGNWNVSGVTDFDSMFYSNTSFNQPIGNWDILNTTNVGGMFWGATSFNQNINNWDVSNVNSAYGIFNGCTSFNQPLDSWDVSNLNNPFSMQYMFNGCTSFNQDLSSWCVPSQPSLPPNFDTGASSWLLPKPVWGTCPPFISIWRTTGASETITLPYLIDGTYDGIIDWGDGNTSVNTYANRTHTYVTPGDYTITISGDCVGFKFFNTVDKTKIREITQWGSKFRLGNNGGYFYGCSNLVLSGVTDVLNLQGTTSLNITFLQCSQITTINRINEWNVSSVTNMASMFSDTPFNQDISNWDVSNVTGISAMFYNSPFNQPIGNWNVSNVNNMNNMFSDTPFNQDINNWDVSKVQEMGFMFRNTPFNQDISSWNVSGVTNMLGMFQSTPFNQDISSWDVSSVTNMDSMFSSTPFNQNIGGWNVSSVTNMGSMFFACSSFNQDLSSWCVPLIPSLPSGFNTNTFSWVLPKPIWGTCPT